MQCLLSTNPLSYEKLKLTEVTIWLLLKCRFGLVGKRTKDGFLVRRFEGLLVSWHWAWQPRTWIKWIPFCNHLRFLLSGFCFVEWFFKLGHWERRRDSFFVLFFPLANELISSFFLANEFISFWNLQSFPLCSRYLSLTWIYLQPLQEIDFKGKSEPGGNLCSRSCRYLTPGSL